jgi:hypothetical protein
VLARFGNAREREEAVSGRAAAKMDGCVVRRRIVDTAMLNLSCCQGGDVASGLCLRFSFARRGPAIKKANRRQVGFCLYNSLKMLCFMSAVVATRRERPREFGRSRLNSLPLFGPSGVAHVSRSDCTRSTENSDRLEGEGFVLLPHLSHIPRKKSPGVWPKASRNAAMKAEVES